MSDQYGSAEHEKFAREVLKQREIDEIKRLGLPYLKAGMSHRAVQVQLKRAQRSAEVRERILKAWDQEKRSRPQPELYDPAEKVARAVLAALDSGGDQKRRAEEFLKNAHPAIKQKMFEISGAASEFKNRRSKKTNGF